MKRAQLKKHQGSDRKIEGSNPGLGVLLNIHNWYPVLNSCPNGVMSMFQAASCRHQTAVSVQQSTVFGQRSHDVIYYTRIMGFCVMALYLVIRFIG